MKGPRRLEKITSSSENMECMKREGGREGEGGGRREGGREGERGEGGREEGGVCACDFTLCIVFWPIPIWLQHLFRIIPAYFSTFAT